MKTYFFLLLVLLSVIGNAHAGETDTEILGRLLAISEKALEEVVERPEDYRLMGLQRQWRQSESHWLLTYKPATHFPADNTLDVVGLGGEVFIEVDLHKSIATVRYGE